MKIVFIGGRDILSLGGIESYMFNLTRELTRIGHECVVWCESDHHEVKMLDGVKVIYHPGPKSNLICKPWCGLKATIKTVFSEKGVDVVHYNAWPASLWSWIPRLFGIKSILQGHGFEWRHSKYSSKQKKILKIMEGITAWTNTNIILVSDEQTDYFKVHYRRNAHTIPTAVNMPTVISSESDIDRKYGLEPLKFFLFLGRLSKEKNVDYLIWAFKHIKDFKLVIAGTNTVEPEYVNYLHNQGANNANVVFTGPAYGSDKDWLLRNAYCFCLPSTTEGMSIALLEAMSYRLPIIASDIIPNKEVLKDNGLYVRPENISDLINAYNEAICDPLRLREYVEHNYNIVKWHFTWDKVAKKYVEYLNSIGIG